MSWLAPAVILGAVGIHVLAFAVVNDRAVTGTSYGGRAVRFVGGPWLRDWFYWTVAPATRFAVRVGWGPTALNAAGLLLGVAAGVLIGLHHLQCGALAVLLAGVADALDGEVARALGVASEKGSFIDASLDRIVDAAVFSGVTVYFRTWDAWLLLVVLVAGYSGQVISYLKARGEAHGVEGFRGLMQRSERVLAVGIAALFDPVVADLTGSRSGVFLAGVVGVVALLSAVTVATRFRHGVVVLAGREKSIATVQENGREA